MRRGNRGISSYERRANEERRDGRAPDVRVNEPRRDGRVAYERHDQRGAGPGHAWYRGDRLPAEYRHRSYVVDDWRGHQLSAPPRGYQWVQTGGDFVLVAIASGIIAQLVLGG
jgi:Ni/Co efflux regulator RcnB